MPLSKRVRHITTLQIANHPRMGYNNGRGLNWGCLPSYESDEYMTIDTGWIEGEDDWLGIYHRPDPSEIPEGYVGVSTMNGYDISDDVTYGDIIDRLAATNPSIDYGWLTEIIEDMFEDDLGG